MNITLIVGYFYPEQSADTHLNLDIAYGLRALGHKIKVVAPFPDRGLSEEQKILYEEKRHEVIDQNLEIFRVGKRMNYDKTFVKKSINLLKKTYAIYNEVKNDSPDLFFVVSTPPFLGYIAMKLSKRGYRIVYKLQDVFPDSLIQTKNLNEKLLAVRCLRRFESKLYDVVDRIITCSNDVKKTLTNRNVPQEKITVIHDWIDTNTCSPVEREANFLFDKYSIDRNGFIVSYAGNVGYLQDLETMVMAAKELVGFPITFLIWGDGTCISEIKTMVAKYGLVNFRILPMQSLDVVSNVYSSSDIGLVMLNKGITDFAFPSKTWSIMSSESMVIAGVSKESELAHILTENNLGEVFEPGDYIALSKLIQFYYINRDRCYACGVNARQYVKNHVNKDKALLQIDALLKEIEV